MLNKLTYISNVALAKGYLGNDVVLHSFFAISIFDKELHFYLDIRK